MAKTYIWFLFATILSSDVGGTEFTLCSFEDLPDSELCEGWDVNPSRIVYGVTSDYNAEEVLEPSPSGDHFLYIKHDGTIADGQLDIEGISLPQPLPLNAKLFFDYYIWSSTATAKINVYNFPSSSSNSLVGFDHESTNGRWLQFNNPIDPASEEIVMQLKVEGKDVIAIDNLKLIYGDAETATTLSLSTTTKSTYPTNEYSTNSPIGVNVKLENCQCHCTSVKIHKEPSKVKHRW